MAAYLWIALGGALGSVARYWCSVTTAAWSDRFPWGTFVVNVAGSFIIGFFGTLTAPEGPLPLDDTWRLFVMVGICGGFTTFSAFSLQTLGMMQSGLWLPAAANVVGSVVLCIFAVWIGHLSAVALR